MGLWLIFVGLVALLPSLATLIISYLHGGTPTLEKLLDEGDGFLIAIAITGDAIGRAVDRGIQGTVAKGLRGRVAMVAAVLCGVVLCFSLGAFFYIKGKVLDHKDAIDKSLRDAPTIQTRQQEPRKAPRGPIIGMRKLPRKGKSQDNAALSANDLVEQVQTQQALLEKANIRQADTEKSLADLKDTVSNSLVDEGRVVSFSSIMLVFSLTTSFWVIIPL